MKKSLKLLVVFILLGNIVFAQYPEGKVVYDHLYSALLENQAGENPTRRVTVYLPPGYEKSEQRYPVIYFLHCFTCSDSMLIAYNHLDKLLDKAIATGKIRPVIWVMPDNYTLFRGSFYTNSSFTGRWADFTAIDLVSHIDKNYRTIPVPESRGLAGHSMGGFGTLKIGMMFPEIFPNLYAMSPAVLGLYKDNGIKNQGFRRIQELTTREEVITGYKEFGANSRVVLGQAFSPNPDKPPFYADMPVTYEGNTLHIHYDILELWNKNMPLGMVDSHIENLRKINALKIDWGRNDESEHIPFTCKMLSQKLEGLGIEHYAEEYIGTHINKLFTDDGRALNDVLPFFDTYLKFE